MNNYKLRIALCYGVAHKLKCKFEFLDYHDGTQWHEDLAIINHWHFKEIEEGSRRAMPIYRDWNDLTKEITHNGETFVIAYRLNLKYRKNGSLIYLVENLPNEMNWKIEKLRRLHFNVDQVPEDQCIYQSQLKDKVYE